MLFLVVNTVTNRVVKLLGKDETVRWMNLSLYQGAPQKKGFQTVVCILFSYLSSYLLVNFIFPLNVIDVDEYKKGYEMHSNAVLPLYTTKYKIIHNSISPVYTDYVKNYYYLNILRTVRIFLTYFVFFTLFLFVGSLTYIHLNYTNTDDYILFFSQLLIIIVEIYGITYLAIITSCRLLDWYDIDEIFISFLVTIIYILL